MVNSGRISFEETKAPIKETVTKFGGQPVWITKPEWPLSKSTGKPMEFICQIKLDSTLFPNSKAQMAYLFMTNLDDEYVDDTWECDGGENAIILQPGVAQIPVAELSEGPSIKQYVQIEGHDLFRLNQWSFWPIWNFNKTLIICQKKSGVHGTKPSSMNMLSRLMAIKSQAHRFSCRVMSSRQVMSIGYSFSLILRKSRFL